MKKTIQSLWLSALGMISLALPAWAKDVDLNPGKGSGFESLPGVTVSGIISGGIRLALIVASLAFFFMLVLGGIRWMVSGGDKAGTQDARNQVTAALIGLVVVFSAWAIVQLANNLFKVDILGGFDFPTFVTK